jgi:hypothetical protein
MIPTKQELIRKLEGMLERERSRLPRIIMSFLLMAVGSAYFVVTWHVYREWSPAAIAEMYGRFPTFLFTPGCLIFKGILFLLCGLTMLLRALDKSRELMLTALLQILRYDHGNAERQNQT